MRSNSKHTAEELESYIVMYLSNEKSYKELCNDYGLRLSKSQFGQKVLRYQTFGLKGIQSKLKCNHYSKEFKKSVVDEHIINGIPIRQLARKYNIPASSTIINWIIKYTKGEEIKNYKPKPEVYMMKGKKKSHEEKIDIVKDCLANSLSYKDTAEKHQVSYHNIYLWVQKYKDYGPDGLIDGRGRGKPSTIQTAEEKLQVEMAVLKARNEYLETENAALKKLDEIERELMLRKRGMKRNTKRLGDYKKKDLQ